MKLFAVLWFALAAVLPSAHGFAAPAVAPVKYYCPMHPQIVQDKPGDCPICSMRLVPMKDEVREIAVPGQAVVRLPADVRARLGVTLVAAAVRNLRRTIRAPARVAHDPELYSALTEYRAGADALAQASSPRTRAELKPLVEAARLKLAHYGLDEEQMEELSSSAHAAHLILPGAHVWVYASVYEQDLPWVKRGQRVRVLVPALPGQEFSGVIRAIDPMLDMASRTATARLIVENSVDRALRLEMYGSAEIAAERGAGLAIPREAVLDTGERQLVYVVRGEDLVPRAVRLGPAFDDFIEVLGGLKTGERVVSPANFLIDAESQIRAAAGAAATLMEEGHAGHAH